MILRIILSRILLNPETLQSQATINRTILPNSKNKKKIFPKMRIWRKKKVVLNNNRKSWKIKNPGKNLNKHRKRMLKILNKTIRR